MLRRVEKSSPGERGNTAAAAAMEKADEIFSSFFHASGSQPGALLGCVLSGIRGRNCVVRKHGTNIRILRWVQLFDDALCSNDSSSNNSNCMDYNFFSNIKGYNLGK